MSKKKKCIFVEGRDCPFEAPQVPFETCQVCLEAWKVEVAIMKKQAEGNHVISGAQRKDISIPVIKDNRLEHVNERFKEIEELLKNDEVDPLEYIKLRKEHINNLIEEAPGAEDKLPKPCGARVAVITKSFFRKQIKTHPVDWELPKEVSGKVIDMIFDIAEEKTAENIKLRSGGYKITCIAAEKNQIALMILDADEEFESYNDEMQRINLIIRTEKMWQDALKKLE